MNKIKILIFLAIFGFGNDYIFTAQTPTRKVRVKRPAQPVTIAPASVAVPTPTGTRKVRVKRSPTGVVGTSQTGRPQRYVSSIKVEPIVLENLSDSQLKQFETLSQNLIKAVSIPFSKNYNLWQQKVVTEAKKILDIDVTLKDYCIEVITEELNKMAEERGIDVEDKISIIENILDQYIVQKEEKAIQAQEKAAQIARENLLRTGTTKEQFNNLLKKENVWVDPVNGKLARQWFSAVVERAQKLIFAHELDAATVEESIRKVLARKFTGDIVDQYVNGIMGEINTRLRVEATRRSPLYVNDQYQNLLLSVDRYWNTTTNQPSEEWIKAMIVAAKNMIKVLKISVNDVERHIGSQLFFVAIDHKKQGLSPAQEAAIMAIIDRIKQSVQS